MADFSKQWCELNDPEMPHDFDIEEVASKIEPEYYKGYICEGFGFTAIGKDKDNKIILYFPDTHDGNIQTGEWKDYNQAITEEIDKAIRFTE